MKTEQAKIKRILQGEVIGNKMNKTILVLIVRKVKHPLYGKYVKRLTKIQVHDEKNLCNEGDIVKIAECRPISKTKQWKLVELVERKKQ